MLRATFSSSAISSASYNPVTGGLHIVFTSGRGYDFCGVPEAVWRGLCSAGSTGTFYNEVIRDHYQC
ncbi:KTSC domain-containing protein [Alteriqipengyuania lutimaris]|uniref:KTSC domain-containing protein n=1 Tax=Alteriqipengyuania lutimaris TaxID=1538146 RepID=A0A395LKE2_9SPHN|nr:KTSC domain-containing protein [Alteriqipengyuania lutimaris]